MKFDLNGVTLLSLLSALSPNKTLIHSLPDKLSTPLSSLSWKKKTFIGSISSSITEPNVLTCKGTCADSTHS